MADNNSNKAELEETIRRCVRDEMRNFQGSRNGVQSLLDRTRTLIRGAAFSTAREIDSSTSTSSSSGSSSAPAAGRSTGTKRPSASAVPGHPYRPLRKKACPKKAPASIPKAVHLIEARSKLISNQSDDEQDDLTDDSVLTFRENMVVVKGEFDLVPDHNEDQIRQELVEVFKTKLPSISKSDFHFVKRERQSIIRPAVKACHKWDFRHVKSLCGQGRLYLQLSIASDVLTELNNDDELSNSPFDSPSPINATVICSGSGSTSTSTSTSSSSHHQQSLLQFTVDRVPCIPGPSRISCTETHASPETSGLSTIAEEPTSSSIFSCQIEELKAIFPGIPEYRLMSALETHKSVPAAAEALTDDIYENENSSFTHEPNVLENPQSALDILVMLRKQIELGAEKLKVDEEDVVSDVFHYYKNPRFDPKKGLRICLKGKTAIDTGGVLRQVYTNVFSALAENKYGLTLFKGDPKREVPVFSNMHVLTGIFEVIGKLIAHSLLQEGPGFPYLAPVIYQYISSGDLQSALLKASCMDLRDQQVSIYIDKVS